DMPLAFHVIVRPNDQHLLAKWLRSTPHDGRPATESLLRHSFLAIDVMAAFTQMMSAGMFEQYPRLKCAILQSGATWIVAWLERRDPPYQRSPTTQTGSSPLSQLPSEYFDRQCVVSADPDETMTAECVRRLGADHFIWASDYPHIDASVGVLEELERH